MENISKCDFEGEIRTVYKKCALAFGFYLKDPEGAEK